MEINPNFSEINRQTNQELIELYKNLIELRHKETAISDGSIHFHFKRHPQVLVYERDEFLIIVNLADKKHIWISQRLPILLMGKLLIINKFWAAQIVHFKKRWFC